MAFQFGIQESPKYKIKKHCRLIELFGGVGTQSMALRDLGVDYESWLYVDFDDAACKSYNAIHGTNYKPTNVKEIKGKDLNIVDKEHNEYILTYSFPCQSLSTAGYEAGYSRDDWLKGNSTRSGMLWEVERILKESIQNAKNENKEPTTYLPQVLVMENVIQVHSRKHEKDWKLWLDFLESIGYKSFYNDLNARDFNIPQNRQRCFMISILGDYSYKFPKPIGLSKKIEDCMEKSVNPKFYIKKERQEELIEDLKKRGFIK